MTKHWIALLCCLLCWSNLRAQTIAWQPGDESQAIGNRLRVLKDEGGKLDYATVSSPAYAARFEPSKGVNLNLGYTDAMFWLRFTFNNTSAQPLVLELAQAGLPVTELYYKDGDKVVRQAAGFSTPYDRKLFRSPSQCFSLPPGMRTYFVRLNTNSGPIPVRIWTPRSFSAHEETRRLLWGFYFGLMGFIFLLNIFFYFSLRNWLYLYYAVCLLFFAAYGAVVIDGFIVCYIHRIDLLFWYNLLPQLGLTFQIVFAIYFLDVRRYRPKLYRFAWWVFAYSVAWLGVKFLLPFSIAQPVTAANATLMFLLMGTMGIRVGKRGNRLGYYFAFAYIIYFLLVILEATYINTGSPGYLGGLSWVSYATMIEAFTLSFLLTKRFEWEKEKIEAAKTQAQQHALETTQENERIVREQNVLLEQRVEERTHQLSESLQAVEAERQKAEALLHNILPEEIAEELKQFGASEARQYENVSVLFTDFINFTGISQLVTPQRLVAEIDLCYKAFDEITERNGLEKIKTIGDAYLAVCGLPVADSLHAERTVSAALQIQAFMQERKANGGLFNLRAGVNSGQVIAGIVGTKKFAYDIWGDTVNTAQRIESKGEGGRLNVSEATYALIKDRYDCEYRGKIDAKNKGTIDMYFVTGEKVGAG